MKLGYPNISDYQTPSPHYDLHKWMEGMKNIYIKSYSGASKQVVTDEITEGWNTVEKRDFINWMKYYESKDYLKYKTAQLAPQTSPHKYYVSNDVPNYFLPLNTPRDIPNPVQDFNKNIDTVPMIAAQEYKKEQDKIERKKTVEEHRKKILGRLHSVEKLLSSEEGQVFAGPEFEKLLLAIYELKRQIQIMNKDKVSTSIDTYVDLIIRQANILKKAGCDRSSQLLIKFAQNTPGAFEANLGALPLGDKIDGTGTLENPTPSNLGTPPPDDKDKASPPKEDDSMTSFLSRLENLGLSDNNTVEDPEVSIEDDILLDQEVLPESEDDLIVDELGRLKNTKKANYNRIFIKAQAAPPAQPIAEAPIEAELPPEAPAEVPTKAAPSKEPLEVVDDPNAPKDNLKNPETDAGKDYGSMIDTAFGDITVDDVIKKLEAVNKIFKIREVARQISIVDLMLNKLGLSSMFSELSEILSKNLESSNYCQTRIENIISSLRGTMEAGNLDLTEENPPANPQVAGIKDRLQKEQDNEAKRKNMRKKEDVSEKPGLEVENAPEELAAAEPMAETAPAPIPRKPAPTPPTPAV